LARLLRVDERSLPLPQQARPARRTYQPRTQPKVQAPPTKSVPSIVSGIQKREVHILGILIRNPDIIYRIDRNLQEDGLLRIGDQDFQGADHKTLIQLLKKSLKQNDIEPLDHLLNHLSDPLMNPTDGILEQTQDFDPDGEEILKDVLRALIMLREENLSQELDHLRFLQEAAQETGDLKADEYQDTMMQYAILRGRLHKAKNRYTNHSLTE